MAIESQQDVDKLIRATNREIEESKQALQDLANEVAALADIVQPALEKQIQALRTARMATVNEIQATLPALREIRKFFTESGFETEMANLERFVGLCNELQKLKEAGVIDAVADVMIKLALATDGKS